MEFRREAWVIDTDLRVVNTYAVIEVMGMNEVAPEEGVEQKTHMAKEKVFKKKEIFISGESRRRKAQRD